MIGSVWVFIALHFWTIGLSLGGIGAVVMVVAVACFGWQVGAIFTAVVNLARTAIQFFETPFGEAIGILLLVIAVAVAVDFHQIRVDEAAYKVKLDAALSDIAKKADEDRKARDDYVAQKVKADTAGSVAQIEAEKDDLEQKAKDYETALKNSATAACTVAPGDLPVRVPDRQRRH
jgi:hypothetical protein